MPYIQDWGISRLSAVSPLNNNGSKSIMDPNYEKEPKQTFGFEVNTSPDSDNIIEQNNDISNAELDYGDDFDTLNDEEKSLRKERIQSKQSDDFFNQSAYDMSKSSEEEVGSMYKNNAQFRNAYHDYADKNVGDNWQVDMLTAVNNPVYALEHLKSYIPGLEKNKEWSESIKGDNKDFFTGLRKTTNAFNQGDTEAYEKLTSNPKAFAKQTSSDFLPPLVLAQSASNAGAELGKMGGGTDIVGGQLINKKYLPEKEKKTGLENIKDAAVNMATYAPYIRNVKKGQNIINVVNTANKFNQKAYKVNKLANVKTQVSGQGKSSWTDKVKDAYNYVTKPADQGGGQGGKVYSSTVTAPTALTGKVASWLARKFTN
jgi:hypothetical protein